MVAISSRRYTSIKACYNVFIFGVLYYYCAAPTTCAKSDFDRSIYRDDSRKTLYTMLIRMVFGCNSVNERSITRIYTSP